MVICSVYIVSKSGGLIFNYDHNLPKIEQEKSFSYPLDIKLHYENKKVVVVFGQRDGIMVGHILVSVNGIPLNGNLLEDNRDVFEVLSNEKNYPLNLKFSRPKMTTNEKIFLARIKFMIVAEPSQAGMDQLLRRIYELYADFALKNPFYSLEMPIRCELFDFHLQSLLEQVEKSGITNI